MVNIILEDLICILFLCAVGAVFAGCTRVCLRMRKHGWREYKLNWREICILLTGLFGCGCICYAAVVEPFQLEVKQIAISSPKLSTPSPIRIIHISDTHCDGIIRNEKRLPPTVKSLNPDIILFTGDAAENVRGARDFRECLEKLGEIAPVFAVNGNRDQNEGSNQGIYTGLKNVTFLYGGAKLVNVKGSTIWLGGTRARDEKLVEKVLCSAPSDKFTIFLYHFPKGIIYAAAHHVDLFCAGHTHGGQVCLPFYGALTTLSEMGKQFECGLYKVNSTYCYISRGIGMTGLPVRFLAPPEITVINLIPSH